MAARILMCGAGGSNLELYKASLEDEGHDVVVLPDPEVCRAALEEEAFGLVLADLEDAGEEARRFLEELREGGVEVVLAVLPDMPEPEDAEALRRAGARELLVRPFSMTRLALSVENALEAGRMQAALEDDAPPPARPSPAELSTGAPAPEPGAASASPAVLRKAQEYDQLAQRLETLEESHEDVRGQLRRREQELTRLREELQAAHEGEAALRARLERREGELGEQIQELDQRYEQYSSEQRKARENLEQELAGLVKELEERTERHRKQLEVLNNDESTVQASYEERFQGLTQELQSARARLEAAVQEKEELLVQMNEDRGTFKALRTHLEDAQREADETRRSRDELQKKLENEVRKRFNEVRVLVKERKKLLDENHELAQNMAKQVDQERSERKQLEVELESLKATLPTERKKVHALVEYQRSLIENVLAGILTVDTSGIITLGNELAAKHLDTRLSDLLGTHVDQNTAFGPLRPLFAQALTQDSAGPMSFEVRDGVTLQAVATKVPFGPRELVLLSFIAPETVEVQTSGSALDDEGPLARLGAAVAGNITDVQDFSIEIRGYLERLYGKTEPDSPAREECNGALRKVGELIDFLRDIIEQAESYLS